MDYIRVLNLYGNLEEDKVDLALQVSRNGDKSETITLQTVITDDFDFKDRIEQCIKGKYGDSIKITRSILVEDLTIQIASEIKKIQELEDSISDTIEDRKERIRQNKEDIIDLASKADVYVDDPEDVDPDDVDDEQISEEIEGLIWDNEVMESELSELQNLKGKVTFGEKYSEKFTSKSSQIIDNIMKNVPFGAILSYFMSYQNTVDFFQYNHIFTPFMVPLDMEFGGFDGENFDFENTEECYQVLKNTVYQLYKNIPGKEYGFRESEGNNMKNAAVLIREKITSSNPDFSSRDNFHNNYDYKYLHDKLNDCDYYWYKRCNEHPSEVRTPNQEDFNRFLSKCDDEELRELIVSIFKDKASCLERSELIGFIYELYKDNLEYA